MEALAQPPNSTGKEPELVFEWASLHRPPVRKQAWIVSLVVHLAGVGLLLMAPHEVFTSRVIPASAHVSLIAPPRELTQTAPNRAQVGHEFSLDNLVPRPPVVVPPAVRPMARSAPVAPPVVRRPAFVPEPPSVDTARVPPAGPPPGLGSGAALPAPPPQIQTEEKPKLMFETPGAPSGQPKAGGLGQPRIQVPHSSVMEAARAAIHSGGGGLTVGDADITGSAGLGGGIRQAPAPGRTATALEMQSDPMGVDFKPYLIQILAAVKRNWLAVLPESARLGRQGRVQIQFAIDRNGSVPKLVIALPSGTEALDRAAVAGVSASNPFPPLPADFKGSQIRLQFTFSYNLR